MKYLPEHDVLLFLGSPWVRQLADLKSLDLHLSDFPPHDALPDLLFLLQAETSAFEEISTLADQLAAANEAAEKALKVKDEFIAAPPG